MDDSLTRELKLQAKKIGTDYQCLSSQHKTLLGYIYFFGMHGRNEYRYVSIEMLSDFLGTAGIKYFNKESRRRTVRRIIKDLRMNKWPILSSYKKGYYWPRDVNELLNYSLKEKRSVIRRLKTLSNTFNGGLSMFTKQIKMENNNETKDSI